MPVARIVPRVTLPQIGEFGEPGGSLAQSCGVGALGHENDLGTRGVEQAANATIQPALDRRAGECEARQTLIDAPAVPLSAEEARYAGLAGRN